MKGADMIEKILIGMYRGDGKRRLAPAKKDGWRMTVFIVREFTGDGGMFRKRRIHQIPCSSAMDAVEAVFGDRACYIIPSTTCLSVKQLITDRGGLVIGEIETRPFCRGYVIENDPEDRQSTRTPTPEDTTRSGSPSFRVRWRC